MKKILFISLAVVFALSVGLIGCEGEGPAPTYELTTASGLGGDVEVPGEGTDTHDEGAVVQLRATACTNYDFVNWTGDVSNVADVDAAETSITMNADAEVTANFVWAGNATWTDTITLDFHCTAGTTASVWNDVYAPWINNVTSGVGPDGGKIEFNVTYGSTPYDAEDSLTALSSGVVDVGQLSTDTFYLGQIGYLPFIFSMESAAYATHYIYEENWDALGELDEVHMLLASPLQPAQWWGNVNVTQLSDLSGLDVRAEGKEVPIVDALGATPQEYGTMEIYSALDTGAIDGNFFTYSGGVFWLALFEVAEYTSEVNMVLPRYMLAMNEDVYECMHPDARAFLDSYCTVDESVLFAEAHSASQAGAKDKLENGGYPVFGNTRDIYEIPQSELDNWEAACSGVFTDFVTDMNALGFDGQGILDRVNELIAEYEAS